MATYGFCENKCKHELDTVKVSPTEPTNNEKVWIKKGKNLFNKDDYSIDYQGYIGFNLKLELGKTYTLSSNKNLYIAKFSNTADQNNDNVGPQKWSEFTSWTFVARNNANNFLNNRLFLGVESSDLSKNINDFADFNIQIEEGSTATEYEAYTEKKIFCKNDNGEYTEFVNIETMGIDTITDNNGIAIKYPNGTMICSGTFRAIGINTEEWHESYAALIENPVTFPFKFTKTYSVNVDCVNTNHAFWIHRIVFDTKQITTVEISRPSPVTDGDAYFSYTAIGTWK